MLIIDAHQDIAWNKFSFGRDITRSAQETRRIEGGIGGAVQSGDALIGWPEYQRGRIAAIFATLFVTPAHRVEYDWENLYYVDANQAYTLYRAQLDFYQRLVEEHPDKFRIVRTQDDLLQVLSPWEQFDSDYPDNWASDSLNSSKTDLALAELPVGMVLLMEGAEGVRMPAELDEWWSHGVRLIGPAWAGTRFCGGTREPGPLTNDGYALLDGMADFGFLLDISHMDELAVLQALDYYPGRVLATHANALALLKEHPSNRHLSDHVIRGLIEREGIIGVVPHNVFLKAGWKKGERRSLASIFDVVAHIDHICQIAGDASHVAIGSDFDGGFGLQSVPPEFDTIADLRKLIPLLAERGYEEGDIRAIMGQNWIKIMRESLPEGA